MVTSREGKEIQKRLDAIENAVATLTVWIAQSSVGVISPHEAGEILKRLNSKKGWVQKPK